MFGADLTNLIALCAVALSALLSACGYLYKIRQERLKSKKLVLFHLLEIHYLLKTASLSTDGLADKYLDHCRKILVKKGFPVSEGYDEQVLALAPLIQSYFDHLFKALQTKLDDQFRDSYYTSLMSLASDCPVLAYRLKGKQFLEQVAIAIGNYTKDLKSHQEINRSELLGTFYDEQLNRSSKEAFSEILKDLNIEIRKIAQHCGLITFIRVNKTLEKKIELNDDFDTFELEEMLDSYFIEMMQHLEKSKSEGSINHQ